MQKKNWNIGFDARYAKDEIQGREKNKCMVELLSIREENKLSVEEKQIYYEELRRDISQRKPTNTTIGGAFWGPKLKKVTNKIAEKIGDILSGGKVEKVYDGQENIPDGAVLFAHTHQGILDNFAWIPATPKHCLVLHGAIRRKLLLVAQLNTGLILVNKEDRESRKNAKLDMIHHLLNGHSVVVFPEATWNLSPNKLHLPLNWGFLDVARKADVPVVPVVDEYTYDTRNSKEHITKIHIRFGKPIYITFGDSLEEKLLEYQESISTMRYELIEEKGFCKRTDVSSRDYINYIEGNIYNLKMGRIDINVERGSIYNEADDFWKFHHINNVPYDESGNFLDTAEVERLKKINRG